MDFLWDMLKKDFTARELCCDSLCYVRTSVESCNLFIGSLFVMLTAYYVKKKNRFIQCNSCHLVRKRSGSREVHLVQN